MLFGLSRATALILVIMALARYLGHGCWIEQPCAMHGDAI